MTGAAVLIVEDRDSLRRLFERALEQAGYTVTAVGTAARAFEALTDSPFDAVVSDLKLPDGSGIEVLKVARERQPDTPVVVMTAYGSVSTAVEAMKLGAVDFLEKPVEIDDLTELLGGLLRPDDGEDGSAIPALEIPGGPPIVGRHPRLKASLRLLQRVAPTDSTVLLTGESGTGKELFARAIHGFSPRAKGPFVALNCAAIPETLIENELFGHEKGAFTGASGRQSGHFEQAGGGTLLLDEIGELGLAVQAKVLRVLEDRKFQRVGGGAPIEADVRLIAATNRDLKSMVDAGEFRSDLFYRLDVFPLELAPLRERASDVPILARHLLRLAARRHGLDPLALSEDAAEFLSEQEWPGNVRQLANVLERALILRPGETLDRASLETLLQPLETHDDTRRELERALEESDGDKKRAASLLGVSYRTLLRRVKEYDLEGFPHYRG